MRYFVAMSDDVPLILDVKGLIEELNEFIILLDLTTLLLNLLLGLQCTNKGGLGIIDGGLAECKG